MMFDDGEVTEVDDATEMAARADMHWAHRHPDEMPDVLMELEKTWCDALDAFGLRRAWYLIYCQTYGIDPHTSHQTGGQYVGENFDSFRYRTNLTRPNVKQSIMLAIGERPSFEGVANNNNVSALAQVGLVTKLVDSAMQAAQLEEHAYRAIESDRFHGKGWISASWDNDAGQDVTALVPAKDDRGQPIMVANPQTGMFEVARVAERVPSGDVELRFHFPWEVVTPLFTKSDGPWRIIKTACNKHDLASKYPELRSQILAVDNLSDEDGFDQVMFGYQSDCVPDDLVIRRDFYMEAGPGLPQGRHYACVGPVTLFDRACPVRRGTPVVEFCTTRYFGTLVGYPEVSDLVAQAEVFDDILSQMASNLMRFGNQSLWGETGVEYDEERIAAGGGYFTLGQGQQPPRAIQWAAMPDVSKFLLEFLPGIMNQVSGLNSTVLGRPEGNVQSGTAMALLVNVAERYQHATQVTYDVGITKLANIVLELIRANAENGYASKMTGAGGAPYLRFFKREEIGGVHSVQMRRRNPLLSTFPVRLDIFNATKDLPQDQKRQAYELLLTGSVDAFMEEDHAQTFLLRWEEEQLLRAQPVAAAPIDDHRIHNVKHRGTYDKLRVWQPESEQDKNLQIMALQAVMEHMLDHVQKWMGLDASMAASIGVPTLQSMGVNVLGVGSAQPNGGGSGGQPGSGAQPKRITPNPSDNPEAPLPEPAQPPPESNL